MIRSLTRTARTALGGRVASAFLSSASKNPSLAVNNVLAPTLAARGIELLVCDMAGTVVDEDGLVYKILRKVMNDVGLDVSVAEMHPWHGAAKTEVVAHFLEARGRPAAMLSEIDAAFEEQIQIAYFAPDSPMKVIHPDLKQYLDVLRSTGVKVALNTGYPAKIQDGILAHLDLAPHVDAFVCAGDVGHGRPYPYMVHALMAQLGISDVRKVAKAGDTVRDIEEGLQAGCGLNIGVLSGADDAATLIGAGADIILPTVVDLGIPGVFPEPKISMKSFRGPTVEKVA